MSDMIERIARAIAVASQDLSDDWPAWEREARAAIEAMREPTEAMKEAVFGADIPQPSYSDYGTDADWDYPTTPWQAMIDAALKP